MKKAKNLESELFALQAKYKDTGDNSYLGKMLSPDLLPALAHSAYWYLIHGRKFHLTREEREDILSEAPLNITDYIQRGWAVKKSWSRKMDYTVSNLIRSLFVLKGRQVSYDDAMLFEDDDAMLFEDDDAMLFEDDDAMLFEDDDNAI